MSEVIFVKIDSLNNEFLIKLQHLMNEYGYQLPIDLEEDMFLQKSRYNAIWNKEYVFDERNMTAYISKIRQKIEPDPAHPRYIITVWGVGYKFNGKMR